jgi:hypothetical protein
LQAQHAPCTLKGVHGNLAFPTMNSNETRELV